MRIIPKAALAFVVSASVCTSCGNGNPLERVRLRSDAIVWKGDSADGKVTAYLLRDFQGGATGDSVYDVVVADAGTSSGLRILRCDLDGPPTAMDLIWEGNVLRVRYRRATIWDFSNGYPYGNGNTARTYEVLLEKKRN